MENLKEQLQQLLDRRKADIEQADRQESMSEADISKILININFADDVQKIVNKM